jgi:uncharacterized membrane protein YphA (DoxX/SURF4 family)
MKSVKIAYWIFTILLFGLMLMSAIGSFFPNPEGIAMMEHLGYPYNVLTLLSIAKILGIIAILVPGFPRLKEWAYAGFCFDLIGALYAALAAGDSLLPWMPLVIGLGLLFGSYFCYHKILRLSAQEKLSGQVLGQAV